MDEVGDTVETLDGQSKEHGQLAELEAALIDGSTLAALARDLAVAEAQQAPEVH